MKKSIRLLVLFITVILLTSRMPLISQNYNGILGNDYYNGTNAIYTAVPYLLIPPDARAGALGDAGAASTPDANSMYYNPAKYAFIDSDLGFSASYTPWLRAIKNDCNLFYFSNYIRIGKKQTIAKTFRYFSMGDIAYTNDFGQVIGTYKPKEFSYDIAYARKLSEKISMAIALRYIYSDLTGGIFVGGAESRAGQSIAADVATYYRTPVFNSEKTLLSFGVNISNIGSKISYTENSESDFIPINLRLGPALSFNFNKYNQLAILFDFNKLLVPTPPIWKTDDSTGLPVYGPDGKREVLMGRDPDVGVVSGMFGSFSDAPGGFREEIKEITIACGLEYKFYKYFALRNGFFYESSMKGNRKFFTLGTGFHFCFFGFDISYLLPVDSRSPLKNTFKFSSTLDFNFRK